VARLRERLFPNPGFYGWRVVGICFLCTALTSPGQSFVLSLYIDPLMADLGMSRVGISSLYALCTLAAAACLPVVGGWADRFPARRYLPTVLILLGGAILFLASVQGVVMLALAFFALRLLGQGSVSLGTLTVTVRWFRRYRGRALALVTLGFAAGELVFPGAIYWLTERFGWRGSLLVIGALYLFLFPPLVWRIVREPRAGDGAPDGEDAEAARRSGYVERPDPGFSRAEALQRPVFWGMLACMAVVPLVITAVVFHQVAIFASMGWATVLVPIAFAGFALGGVVGTYGTGLLLERIPVRFGVPISMSFVLAAFLSLLLPLAAAPAAILYGTLLGLCAGSTGATNELVWPDYFGIQAVGALKGVVNAVRNGATAAGPPLAALLVTDIGLFTWSFVLFAALCATAAVVGAFLRPPEEVGGR